MQPIPAKVTSKGQFTIPKSIRKRLGIQHGTTLSVHLKDGAMIARPKRRELAILKYRGWLKDLDDGRPLKEIREEAHRAAAEYVLKRAHRQ